MSRQNSFWNDFWIGLFSKPEDLMVTLFLRGVHGVGAAQESNRRCSGGVLSRVTITCPLVPCMAGGLAEWLRYFNDLAVGERTI